MPELFTPITIRDQVFANRAWVSPMCQYSAIDGIVGDWHLVHLGAYANGRAGLIMTEATGVTPEGRITPDCPGIWNGDQIAAWRRITDYLHGQGAVVGMQLAHAGRKASTAAPWKGSAYLEPAEGGWQTIGPSAVGFGPLPAPREMTREDTDATTAAFVAGARRAIDAGFDVIELHGAHGYLMHQFLSPLSNQRSDEYGGSLENRMRFPIAVAAAVREVWPAERPLFMRISTTDWVDGGWDLDQSVVLVQRLAAVGVDLIDASSGGAHPAAVMPETAGYQSDIAREIRSRTGVLTAAVGRITDPMQADALIRDGQVDAVFLARQLLRDPHWPLRAAHELGAQIEWAPQYARAASWRS